MIKRHSVVLEKPGGGVELYPMKQWLRENPEYLPEGMHPDANTSHELRAALRKDGWRLDVRSDQVLVIKPNDADDTLYAIEALPDSSDDEEVIEAEEITFGLERDLQSALRANIHQLEPGLRIIDEGRERVTEAGRIDITAADQEGTIVVIELKAGTASPEVVAQILAYMGTIAESENKPVRGILVAADFHKRVVFASRAISNLELKKYSVQFRFDTLR
jgi:RecB family endonuclease NucS